MPTIYTIRNLRIVIYPNDHLPPHVHVIGPDGEVRVFFGDGTVQLVRGTARGTEDALEWGAANATLLAARWAAIHPEDPA